MPSFTKSGALVRVIMLSAALAMLVCGCLSVLVVAIELALHRTHIDDVLVASGSAQHQRLQPRIENVGRDGIDELHLEQLRRLDLVQPQPPAVDLAQIDLLPILIVTAAGEQRLAAAKVFIEVAPLRQRRAVQDAVGLPARAASVAERTRCRARCASAMAPRSSS